MVGAKCLDYTYVCPRQSNFYYRSSTWSGKGHEGVEYSVPQKGAELLEKHVFRHVICSMVEQLYAKQSVVGSIPA